MGWKVKAAINNPCDSCRRFCIISQRIQIRLRPSGGTEGEEIFFLINVLPLWRPWASRGSPKGDSAIVLAGCQDMRMVGEETQYCSLLWLL